ncbi:MAG: hypothetical protein LBU25_06925 [Treponema sp.]|nr:hypothetical protein [Treponema sp.]
MQGYDENPCFFVAAPSYERELSRVFTLISRTSNIKAIMKEQQFQRSLGFTDSDAIGWPHPDLGGKQAGAHPDHPYGKPAPDHQGSAGHDPGYGERDCRGQQDTRDLPLPQLAVLPFAAHPEVNQSDMKVLAQLLAVEIAITELEYQDHWESLELPVRASLEHAQPWADESLYQRP